MKYLKPFLVASSEFIQNILFWLPRYRLLGYLKAMYLRLMGAKIGKRVVFYPGVWIAPGRNLVIEDDVDLALGVLMTTQGGIRIGARTLIGYRSTILSSNHEIPVNRGRIFKAGRINAAVNIGSDVWIGANVTVLPGTTIGEGSVVGAGSVVTKDIPPFTVAVGVPARVIRERN